MPNCFFCLEKIMIFSKSPALFHEYKQQEEATSSISMGYQKSMHSPKLKKQMNNKSFPQLSAHVFFRPSDKLFTVRGVAAISATMI